MSVLCIWSRNWMEFLPYCDILQSVIDYQKIKNVGWSLGSMRQLRHMNVGFKYTKWFKSCIVKRKKSEGSVMIFWLTITRSKIVHNIHNMHLKINRVIFFFIYADFKHTQFDKKPIKKKKWYYLQIILLTYSKNRSLYLIYCALSAFFKASI